MALLAEIPLVTRPSLRLFILSELNSCSSIIRNNPLYFFITGNFLLSRLYFRLTRLCFIPASISGMTRYERKSQKEITPNTDNMKTERFISGTRIIRTLKKAALKSGCFNIHSLRPDISSGCSSVNNPLTRKSWRHLNSLVSSATACCLLRVSLFDFSM